MSAHKDDFVLHALLGLSIQVLDILGESLPLGSLLVVIWLVCDVGDIFQAKVPFSLMKMYISAMP